MHKLAGLRRGDTLLLVKENLPGAVLFPALVCKSVPVDSANSIDTYVMDEPTMESKAYDHVHDHTTLHSQSTDTTASEGHPQSHRPVVTVTHEHRFLAVTRERLLVLDSKGQGVGHTAVVKSNNHLTEVSTRAYMIYILVNTL